MSDFTFLLILFSIVILVIVVFVSPVLIANYHDKEIQACEDILKEESKRRQEIYEETIDILKQRQPNQP